MKKKKLLWHGRLTPWLFLLPTIIGLVVFRIVPIVWAFVLSFSKWSLLGSPKFLGFANYIEAFHNENFIQTITNTIQFSIIYVIGSIIFGLILAVLINVKLKSIAFFRAVIYLPVVTSAVAVGIVWNWILGPNVGLFATILESFNITAPYWLGDPKLALSTVATVQVWKMAGYSMILFLAGLQGISAQTLEAATVDGASKIQRFFRITLPMLSPTVFFVLTVSIIDSFKNFELIYAMTKGGPQNATNTLVYDVYLNAFVYYRVGYASAVAFVLLLFVGILTIMNFYIKKNWAQPLE
ncbi:MAG: carbohydrate ABC transporter permease [Pleomorphochaeta sp.]